MSTNPAAQYYEDRSSNSESEKPRNQKGHSSLYGLATSSSKRAISTNAMRKLGDNFEVVDPSTIHLQPARHDEENEELEDGYVAGEMVNGSYQDDDIDSKPTPKETVELDLSDKIDLIMKNYEQFSSSPASQARKHAPKSLRRSHSRGAGRPTRVIGSASPSPRTASPHKTHRKSTTPVHVQRSPVASSDTIDAPPRDASGYISHTPTQSDTEPPQASSPEEALVIRNDKAGTEDIRPYTPPLTPSTSYDDILFASGGRGVDENLHDRAGDPSGHSLSLSQSVHMQQAVQSASKTPSSDDDDIDMQLMGGSVALYEDSEESAPGKADTDTDKGCCPTPSSVDVPTPCITESHTHIATLPDSSGEDRDVVGEAGIKMFEGISSPEVPSSHLLTTGKGEEKSGSACDILSISRGGGVSNRTQMSMHAVRNDGVVLDENLSVVAESDVFSRPLPKPPPRSIVAICVDEVLNVEAEAAVEDSVSELSDGRTVEPVRDIKENDGRVVEESSVNDASQQSVQSMIPLDGQVSTLKITRRENGQVTYTAALSSAAVATPQMDEITGAEGHQEVSEEECRLRDEIGKTIEKYASLRTTVAKASVDSTSMSRHGGRMGNAMRDDVGSPTTEGDESEVDAFFNASAARVRSALVAQDMSRASGAPSSLDKAAVQPNSTTPSIASVDHTGGLAQHGAEDSGDEIDKFFRLGSLIANSVSLSWTVDSLVEKHISPNKSATVDKSRTVPNHAVTKGNTHTDGNKSKYYHRNGMNGETDLSFYNGSYHTTDEYGRSSRSRRMYDESSMLVPVQPGRIIETDPVSFYFYLGGVYAGSAAGRTAGGGGEAADKAGRLHLTNGY